MHQYYRFCKDTKTHQDSIETTLTGKPIFSIPQINKGTAFTHEERHDLGLNGKLPTCVETLAQQTDRVYFQLNQQKTRLQKYIFLNALHDKNQVLFYNLIRQHIEELMPIIYTPTVGTAVKTFSQKFRRTRGIYLPYSQCKTLEAIEEYLDNRTNHDIDVIVVTDGEGVLGIGDQGVGAMDIPIAKLAVYTTLGHINPNRTLPIMLDVGTNNQACLADPMYLGWRHKRVENDAYDDFISLFVQAVHNKFPHVFLHWEDLGRENAARILKKYQSKICTFNDDMQGTGIVALAALLSALKKSKQKLIDQNIVIFGGGTAGLGVAQRIALELQAEGLTEAQARAKLWIIDKSGLVLKNDMDITQEQQPYARDPELVNDWENTDLYHVIKHIKPGVLIGCSGVHGAFSQEAITTMAAQVDYPIIMPLSNPNSKIEAEPQDILNWTQGNALIATGSPFAPCQYQDETIPISQCNNALIFPAIGLGVTAVKPKHLTDTMLSVAAQALAEKAVTTNQHERQLLPTICDLPHFVKQIALAIAEQAVKEKHCQPFSSEEIKKRIDEISWLPEYLPVLKKGKCT
ncbi:MAG: NAD-dependent malic enzyme [Pseudomonadota bacterium]